MLRFKGQADYHEQLSRAEIYDPVLLTIPDTCIMYDGADP